MRILLIYPLVSGSTLWMPLGLPFIAAELRRRGHVVSIFDRFAVQSRLGHEVNRINAAMLECVRDFGPDLIGLNTLSPLIYDTLDCVALIRAQSKIPMVAGGYHATALPELTLQKIPGLDGVVTGEGELSLSRLADGEPPERIPGVWWRHGDIILPPTAPAEQIQNLDELPLPAFDLMDMAFYTQRTDEAIRGHNLRTATFVTSRGCYRRCSFCAESVTYGRGVRFHSAEYVLEWIQHMVNHYDVDGLHFHDNDFLADEQRARLICEGLLRAGLHRRVSWGIQARADRLNPEIALLLKSAGCVLVEIGVEVGTQAELDRIGKGATVEMNTQAVAVCRKAGLDVHAYMLTNLEGETIADLEQRLVWMKRARPTSFQWSKVALFPGTALYQEKGEDFFARSDWTQQAIRSYYLTTSLSAIPVDVRSDWVKRHVTPYVRWRNWMDAFRQRPLRAVIVLVFIRLPARLWHGIVRRVRRMIKR